MTDSAPPSPYDAAVSTSEPPASRNASSCAPASAASVSRLHDIVPRPNRDTSSPVVPARLLSMGPTLPACAGHEWAARGQPGSRR